MSRPVAAGAAAAGEEEGETNDSEHSQPSGEDRERPAGALRLGDAETLLGGLDQRDGSVSDRLEPWLAPSAATARDRGEPAAPALRGRPLPPARAGGWLESRDPRGWGEDARPPVVPAHPQPLRLLAQHLLDEARPARLAGPLRLDPDPIADMDAHHYLLGTAGGHDSDASIQHPSRSVRSTGA
jgi:hypothetical protein